MNILITRPINQAQNLHAQIEARGGHAILFPTIEIQALDEITIKNKILQLEKYNIAIFVSPNAVTCVLPLILKQYQHWPSHIKVAVIGEGTAKVLQTYNVKTDFLPAQKQFNSEELLKLEIFNNITDQKIIIFKGEGGRDLLTKELRQRGALVDEANVYQRNLPQLLQPDFLASNAIDIIVCTSVTALQNLWLLTPPEQRTWLQNIHLVVSSERIAVAARNLGFVKIPILADNATDQAILTALWNLN